MKTTRMRAIANQISKSYGQGEVVVEKIDKNIVEIRTELTSEDGGYLLMDYIEQELGYASWYEGGCAYRFREDTETKLNVLDNIGRERELTKEEYARYTKLKMKRIKELQKNTPVPSYIKDNVGKVR